MLKYHRAVGFPLQLLKSDCIEKNNVALHFRKNILAENKVLYVCNMCCKTTVMSRAIYCAKKIVNRGALRIGN